VNDRADLHERLVKKLSGAGIPFMLVGSVAASYHGHPHATFDIDAVVQTRKRCSVLHGPWETVIISAKSPFGSL